MLPIEGWERKSSKCIFTYIHLDLFHSHPLNYILQTSLWIFYWKIRYQTWCNKMFHLHMEISFTISSTYLHYVTTPSIIIMSGKYSLPYNNFIQSFHIVFRTFWTFFFMSIAHPLGQIWLKAHFFCYFLLFG